MPRTRLRSSASAWAEEVRASASRALAATGLSSSSWSAASSAIPMATSLACAPSCRSRSIRRISAALASSESLRVRARWLTRWASSACRVGPSTERANAACQPRDRGAAHTAPAASTRPSGTASHSVSVLVTGRKRNQPRPPASAMGPRTAGLTAPNRP